MQIDKGISKWKIEQHFWWWSNKISRNEILVTSFLNYTNIFSNCFDLSYSKKSRLYISPELMFTNILLLLFPITQSCNFQFDINIKFKFSLFPEAVILIWKEKKNHWIFSNASELLFSNNEIIKKTVLYPQYLNKLRSPISCKKTKAKYVKRG